ncbi:unnamed protein product [Meloidogyne enterolobii]|uniref:Uncharacterized protein n=1 Tax=Meloidogyne enterolobii TaxID=390850 RepID=A0ACB1A7U6_MELEN
MSGINFISVSRCIWIQWLPLFAFFSQITLCLCIGVDRLVAVGFPILYVFSLIHEIHVSETCICQLHQLICPNL